jgi:DNA polymerase IV
MTLCPIHWERAIALIDMNCFFASVEARDFPELRGRPVAVTNGVQGTCIITSSYEARAYGIKTGMRLREARQLYPDLIQRPSRPHVYAEASGKIMRALTDICPDIEIFSVDEAFIDLTPCQTLYGSPVRTGHLLKQAVYKATGLLCSVGISGDKTTAKYAAKLNKPDGFTVIPPWESRQQLASAPVTELCGVAKGIGKFLAERNVHVCGDMSTLPIGELARRFGNPGKRIWYMAQGLDPEPLHPDIADPKSIGHGKILPPKTIDKDILLTYLIHMAVRVCARLRRYHFEASEFFIGLLTGREWVGKKVKTPAPTNDTQMLIRLCQFVLNNYWSNQPVYQVQITALNPRKENCQMDLFIDPQFNEQQSKVNVVVDSVNERYGECSLGPARLVGKSEMPNVIAPSWKPTGHRQSI